MNMHAQIANRIAKPNLISVEEAKGLLMRREIAEQPDAVARLCDVEGGAIAALGRRLRRAPPRLVPRLRRLPRALADKMPSSCRSRSMAAGR